MSRKKNEIPSKNIHFKTRLVKLNSVQCKYYLERSPEFYPILFQNLTQNGKIEIYKFFEKDPEFKKILEMI